MLPAFGVGLLAGSTLVVGALIGIYVRLPGRAIALLMSLGAGVLVASVTYELIGESIRGGNLREAVLGMTAGSVAFFLGDLAVLRAGGRHRKRASGMGSGTTGAGATGMVLALAALMDGIPESAALGVTMLESGAPSIAFLVAVGLSNFPEGLSSAAGMHRAGHRTATILVMWLGIALLCGLASAVGFGMLGAASPGVIAGVTAFAAGAILTMLASTMLPEAAREGGPVTGLATTAGFLVAVLLS